MCCDDADLVVRTVEVQSDILDTFVVLGYARSVLCCCPTFEAILARLAHSQLYQPEGHAAQIRNSATNFSCTDKLKFAF